MKVKTVQYVEKAEDVVKLTHKKDVEVNGASKDLLQVRNSGILMHKAFYLSLYYHWLLVTDDEGLLCLVPRKKEG